MLYEVITGTLLPAMGYGDQQVKDLEATIEKTPCDAVVIATPIDLNRIVKINKPTVKVGYDLQEIGQPDLKQAVNDFIQKKNLNRITSYNVCYTKLLRLSILNVYY